MADHQKHCFYPPPSNPTLGGPIMHHSGPFQQIIAVIRCGKVSPVPQTSPWLSALLQSCTKKYADFCGIGRELLNPLLSSQYSQHVTYFNHVLKINSIPESYKSWPHVLPRIGNIPECVSLEEAESFFFACASRPVRDQLINTTQGDCVLCFNSPR